MTINIASERSFAEPQNGHVFTKECGQSFLFRKKSIKTSHHLVERLIAVLLADSIKLRHGPKSTMS